MFVSPAHAATFTVTNLNDSGAGSLRQAIIDANAAAGADTITFSVSDPITLGSTLPSITDAAGLTMDGAGQTVTISGGNAVRVLFVNTGASLTLNNLTIANGNASSGYGGGISSNGTLTVTNSTFSGNAATGGGGIYNYGALTITNSTFSGNSATGTGGGIYSNTGALAIITNSTFSGNSATTVGGAIYSWEDTLTITNSTFSGNSATGGLGGGGFYNSGGIVTLRNTIVANSTGGNCIGTITNGGNNIDSGTTCGWGAVSGSKSSTPPLLGALANNGGPTQTFALLTGSPAIDGVTFSAPNGAPSTDQRGVARPQGAHCDIGAYETTAQSGPNFVVNATADADDTACDYAPAGNCTLREAINAANALAGANTITFSVSDPITLGSSLPIITAAGGALTMDGTGQTISGGNAVRVLSVNIGASLTLNNLTIANGYSNSSNGGGIYNGGTLNITNSTISGNSSVGYSGGGILNDGTFNITNSTFSGNSASQSGGGILNGGTLNITNSTLSGNTANIWGGGIYNYSWGTMTITNSAFSGNTAVYGGGGIINNGGALTITNSAFSGNTAGTFGGGGVLTSGGTLNITNSTFSGNSATDGGYGGGGIRNWSGTVTLRNTIVANSASGGNCAGTITNDGNNIDDGATCGWFSASGSMSSTNPLLGALANNGGPTQTFALLTDSPAINAGNDTVCAATVGAPNYGAGGLDQRGTVRPQGAHCDIGSYEFVVTATRTPTPTKTLTRTPTRTPTPTKSPTGTMTPTRTLTRTPTRTNTMSPTVSPTPTGSAVGTMALTRTATPTRTSTPTKSPTGTMTLTKTLTSSPAYRIYLPLVMR